LAKYVIISDLTYYQPVLISCLKEPGSTQSLPAISELRCQLQQADSSEIVQIGYNSSLIMPLIV
jgi:hypothetical protein